MSEEHVSGALLGFGVGEALGLPVDGLTAYQIFCQFHADIDGYFEDKRRGTPAGMYSAQTIRACSTVKHIQSVGFGAEAIVATFQYCAALPSLQNSKYEYPTHFGHALAIGIAAGAGNATDLDLVAPLKVLREMSNMDWTDSLACLCFAFIIRELIARPERYKNPFDLYDGKESLLAHLCEICRRQEAKQESLKEELSARLEATRRKLMSTECDLARFIGIHGPGPGMPETLASAIFAYMQSPEHESIFSAVSAGGANSMRGAMVGAMVGATLGSSIFPDSLKDDLHNGPKIALMGTNLAQKLGPKPTEAAT